MQKDSAPSAIPVIDSISSVSVGTDAWLVDIWGVMHNGARHFPDAARACQTFRKIGGTVMLLSNAPRPAASVAAQLKRIGVPQSAYDAILTSGDAALSLIGKFSGRPIHHIGPERDLALFTGLDVVLAPVDEADAVVCTGLVDDETETPEDYVSVLEVAAARSLPMICANPDLKVERAGKLGWCAGGVAAAYTALGGKVEYAGKPYAPVYKLALTRLSELRGRRMTKERVLAIGDGITTDIAGAFEAGIRSVFVASGVHVTGKLDGAALDALFAKTVARPIAAMPKLAW